MSIVSDQVKELSKDYTSAQCQEAITFLANKRNILSVTEGLRKQTNLTKDTLLSAAGLSEVSLNLLTRFFTGKKVETADQTINKLTEFTDKDFFPMGAMAKAELQTILEMTGLSFKSE